MSSDDLPVHALAIAADCASYVETAGRRNVVDPSNFSTILPDVASQAIRAN
ncbi:MAG: hypothetical protein ACXW5U_25575 [Thermoanaerobaculia bacterium]